MYGDTVPAASKGTSTRASECARVEASTCSDLLLASTRISSHSQALATQNFRVLASQKAQITCTYQSYMRKRNSHMKRSKNYGYYSVFTNDCHMMGHIFYHILL